MESFIYLHGFASSPRSVKAQFISDRFSTLQIPLTIPDLNQGDFSHLTLTRQLQQVETIFPSDETPVSIIGSSFGGLTAAWLGQFHHQVRRLVLLAPAFDFLSHWLLKLGKEQLELWKQEKSLSIHHHGEERSLPLHYQFFVDTSQYQESQLVRSIPTLILHGRNDEVIPIEASRDFARDRPWVQLIELDSDHTLGNVLPEIWQAIDTFCQLAV